MICVVGYRGMTVFALMLTSLYMCVCALATLGANTLWVMSLSVRVKNSNMSTAGMKS